jgi:hypothetical protein
MESERAKIIKPMVCGNFSNRRLISEKSAANDINIVVNSSMPM